MSDVKLAICLPLTSEKVYKRFFISWVCLEKPPQYELVLPALNPEETVESRAYVRNSLIEQAISHNQKPTHILMMDTDQFFPHDTIMKLLSHDLPIVTAKVHRRYPPFDPILYRGEIGKYESVPDEEWQKGGLVEIDATGGGCFLFKTEILKSLKKPWFKLVPGNKTRKTVGEDVYFFSQLKKAGLRIFADTSIEVGHTALVEINRHFYELFKMGASGIQD
jgi:hypothetical protein